MADDIRAKLAGLDSTWKDTPPAKGGGGGLPDGKAQLRLTEIKSGRAIVTQDSDSGIRARVGVEVVNCADDTFVGRRGSKSWTLINGDGTPNDMGMSILKTDLQVLGVDGVDTLPAGKIGDALVSCIGAVVDATIKHKTDPGGTERENIYFNGLAQAAPASGASKSTSTQTKKKPAAAKKARGY